jgi:hypothetical protein
MRLSPLLKIAVWITLCLCGRGQSTPGQGQVTPSQGQIAPGKEVPGSEAKGLPPRATPAEYQAQAVVGMVTIVAEFTGHAIGTPQGTLTTEDYVVVETGFFGPAGARTRLAADDFSLRINGKKAALPSQPYGLVLGSLKDPEWEPPADTKSKSKASMGGGGGGGRGGEAEAPPEPVKMPFPIRRAMEQRVQKATLPEGDRALPVAGLIYFQYRGKTQGIKSLELLYSGPAGKATLTLQP